MEVCQGIVRLSLEVQFGENDFQADAKSKIIRVYRNGSSERSNGLIIPSAIDG